MVSYAHEQLGRQVCLVGKGFPCGPLQALCSGLESTEPATAPVPGRFRWHSNSTAGRTADARCISPNPAGTAALENVQKCVSFGSGRKVPDQTVSM